MPTLHNFLPLSLRFYLHSTAPSSSCFSLLAHIVDVLLLLSQVGGDIGG